MDNSKIESLLLQILKNQESMQSDITEIKNKIDSVYEQTANLTEFRTETTDNFNSIAKDVKFIKHKLHETEEDVFDIKDHLKIIK
ncbi:hypothetical protein [Clostridium butyricum]|uniref:hypothetical protein n=1 Tax=Clostridium butyricum TaxID=1492 RepID=UPI002AAFB6CA|nr:hypothetical protein [Clostridium butyricum]